MSDDNIDNIDNTSPQLFSISPLPLTTYESKPHGPKVRFYVVCVVYVVMGERFLQEGGRGNEKKLGSCVVYVVCVVMRR